MPNMPRTLQVGLVCNGWGETPDVRAEFDWVRFSVPQSVADLTPSGER